MVDLTLSGIDQGQWFDLYHGKEIDSVNVTSGVTATLSLDVEAGGYGAVLVTTSGVDQVQWEYSVQYV